jgi:hypothetical protein
MAGEWNAGRAKRKDYRHLDRCSFRGKVSFPTEQKAIKRMNELSGRSDRSKAINRVYLCDVCEQWHLTSQKEREQ